MNRLRDRLARRYARAFLNVFSSSLSPQDLESFKEMARFLTKHSHACFLMELSLLPEQTKIKAVTDLCKQFKLPAFCQKLWMLLIKHQRTSLLPEILYLIVDLHQHDAHIMTFTVSSSVDLSDQQKQKIEKFLHTHVKGSVSCSYVLDKKLIAGIRLQSDSLLWENSVQGSLRMLHESLG